MIKLSRFRPSTTVQVSAVVDTSLTQSRGLPSASPRGRPIRDVWEAPVFCERRSVGLDVHARSVAAAAIDGETGEGFRARLTPSHEEVIDWVRGLPGPSAAVYLAQLTGDGAHSRDVERQHANPSLDEAAVDPGSGTPSLEQLWRCAKARTRPDHVRQVQPARRLVAAGPVKVARSGHRRNTRSNCATSGNPAAPSRSDRCGRTIRPGRPRRRTGHGRR